MEKIFIDSEDQNVAKYVLYAKKLDPYVYVDKEFTEKVSADDVMNATLKGAVLKIASEDGEFANGIINILNAGHIQAEDVFATIVIASNTGIVNFYSKEYTTSNKKAKSNK